MREALLPARNSRLSSRADNVRLQAQEKLGEFSRNQLIANKLIPKTSTWTPTLNQVNNSTSEAKKTLVRLKTLLSRALEKAIPYTTYSTLPILDISARQHMTIQIAAMPMLCPFSYSEFVNLTSTSQLQWISQLKQYKAINRYVERLNFNCRKNRIPVEFSLGTTLQLTSRQQRALTEMSYSTRSNLPANKMEMQVVFVIKAKLVLWVNSLYMNLVQSSEGQSSLNEYLANSIATAGEKYTFDKRHWSSYDLLSFVFQVQDISRIYGGHGVAEKVFFYIPHFLRILKTLSRKSNYVSTAFAIGSGSSAQS